MSMRSIDLEPLPVQSTSARETKKESQANKDGQEGNNSCDKLITGRLLEVPGNEFYPS
ncbi:hypothetical protein L1049_025699 [Liquidambar formosana]|uniref:Uncharacterized protein n=1 Tax=Liquidambar formosana TaxID=63359 RepID=A0AAP0NFJ5_LIQFO